MEPVLWLLATMLINFAQIIAAVLLLRERHIGAWLMFSGSVITLIGSLILQAGFSFLFERMGIRSPSYESIITVVSSFTYLGAFLFAIGLLLHALRLRGRADRIAELEAILQAQHQQR
jgi:uncharacterized BrkB/YihY/UPF0761 family membrane protein